MGNIRKIFTLVLTLVFISFFVAVLFGMGDVRGNLAGLVSTLFNEGLVGFLILIILLYIYYPVYKFFRAFLKIRSLKEALDKSIIKTKIEIWLDRIVFVIVPAIYIIFIVFIK
ncbi:hypothetical protein N8791_06670 [Gammaproteobacteria bacterium]|nr:hypothetical protein [Gammaproteobacteria bacterium]